MDQAQLAQLAEDLERYRTEHIPQDPDRVAVDHAWDLAVGQLRDRIAEETPTAEPAPVANAGDEAQPSQPTLDESVHLLLNSRVFCTACAFAAHKAGGLGGGVQLNLANVIADGNGLCFPHVAFADTAAVEVKTAGGIIIAPGAQT